MVVFFRLLYYYLKYFANIFSNRESCEQDVGYQRYLDFKNSSKIYIKVIKWPHIFFFSYAYFYRYVVFITCTRRLRVVSSFQFQHLIMLFWQKKKRRERVARILLKHIMLNRSIQNVNITQMYVFDLCMQVDWTRLLR